MNIVVEFIYSYMLLGIVCIIYSYLIWKKQYLFLVGYRKNSKVLSAIDDKKRLTRDYGICFLVYGVINILLSSLDYLCDTSSFTSILEYLLFPFIISIYFISRNSTKSKY